MNDSPSLPATLLDAPIGIFDSGIGGLSVLRHVRSRCPHEHLLYFADAAFAPYGQRSEEWIVARSLAVAHYLFSRPIKALVIACNTATAAAVKAVREAFPNRIVVGVEPGLKPACGLTHTGHIGVFATQVTLSSRKFSTLQHQLAANTGHQFHLQACNGLVDLIEQRKLDAPETVALISTYLRPLLDAKVDTLVLGCTHYPFVRDCIVRTAHQMGAPQIQIVDTGDAVARQVQHLLEASQLARHSPHDRPVELSAVTSGNIVALENFIRDLLGMRADVTQALSE